MKLHPANEKGLKDLISEANAQDEVFELRVVLALEEEGQFAAVYRKRDEPSPVLGGPSKPTGTTFFEDG